MCNVLLIGNPNVGKSTLFNSLTKSTEHTGNFHGVTVDETSKKIKLKNRIYRVVDLPGIYSLNTFSGEEDVTKSTILNSANSDIKLVVADCNSIRKNLYLCLQLSELGINYKLLLNNYNYFKKKGNSIDLDKLKQKLNISVEFINAKKTKASINLFKDEKNQIKTTYLQSILQKFKGLSLAEKDIIKAINGIENNLTSEQKLEIQSVMPDIVKERYNYIDTLLAECLEFKENYVYGYSKLDKVVLNPIIMLFGFLLFFFASVYLIFFLIGPFVGELLFKILNFLVINPFNNIILQITDSVWIIEFFNGGVFSSFSTILTFLPQICLMFVFITVLEDSGIISRFAYVLDDFLQTIGLNGKAVYIMLLGLGCNTMSTAVTKSLNGKNLKRKSVILNPYISCMARLPVYVIVASAFFSKSAYLVVVGLYSLGIILVCVLAYALNKTILKTESGELLLEFAPLRSVDIKHLLQVTNKNAKDFLKRVFGVVVSVGIIVWILTHTQFNLQYTNNISNSILFILAGYIKFLFAPIGLNNEGIVTALIIGIMAKELIISTISVTNNVHTNTELIKSLALPTSVIHFNVASAVSFLIFSSIYAPCISNLAVIKKETDTLTMWLTLVGQFTVAYMLSFVVYQTLTKGWISTLVAVIIIAIIWAAIIFIIKKVKHNKCLTCGKCKN